MSNSFSRKTLLTGSLVILGSLIAIYCIKTSVTFFIPCLVSVVFAFVIGLLEPIKGWMLALLYTVILWIGYWLFTDYPENATRQSVELLGLGISTINIFMASALIGFIRRA